MFTTGGHQCCICENPAVVGVGIGNAEKWYCISHIDYAQKCTTTASMAPAPGGTYKNLKLGEPLQREMAAV
jgi:hypothetical protein